MSNRIPQEFEHSSADVGPASPSGAGTSGAGYGGYGYGYGGTTGGESDLSFVHYLQIIYRRRYIATTAFLVVVLSVALFTFTAVRIYAGTVQLLIERDTPNVVSFQEVLEQTEVADDYYETQYQILQSRGLARRTLDTRDLWEHPQFNQPPRLTPRGIVMAPVNMVAGWFAPPRPIEPPGAAETRAQSLVIDRFLSSLTIAPVRFSRLVDVTFTSSDPSLAADVANTLADEYYRAECRVAVHDDERGVRLPHRATCRAAGATRSERAGAAGLP